MNCLSTRHVSPLTQPRIPLIIFSAYLPTSSMPINLGFRDPNCGRSDRRQRLHGRCCRDQRQEFERRRRVIGSGGNVYSPRWLLQHSPLARRRERPHSDRRWRLLLQRAGVTLSDWIRVRRSITPRTAPRRRTTRHCIPAHAQFRRRETVMALATASGTGFAPSPVATSGSVFDQSGGHRPTSGPAQRVPHAA